MVLKYESTKDIKVSPSIADQIIGQDEAVEIIKKASKQRRHVLLIGDPGTGKSLLGQATAELLPKEKLKDILSFPNVSDDNVPIINTVPKGEGKELVTRLKIQSMSSFKNQSIIMFILVLAVSLLPYYFWRKGQISDIIYAASMVTGIIFIIGFVIFLNLNKRMKSTGISVPRLLVDNSGKDKAPFVDATGAHAGALLGDVLHDPLQSFFSSNKIQTGYKKEKISDIVNNVLKKHKKELVKKGSYVAAHTYKNEAEVLAEKDKKIQDVEVLSANKYLYKGNLIKLKTDSGKELIVTPEHKVAVKGLFNRVRYVRADKIRPWHKLIILYS